MLEGERLEGVTIIRVPYDGGRRLELLKPFCDEVTAYADKQGRTQYWVYNLRLTDLVQAYADAQEQLDNLRR